MCLLLVTEQIWEREDWSVMKNQPCRTMPRAGQTFKCGLTWKLGRRQSQRFGIWKPLSLKQKVEKTGCESRLRGIAVPHTVGQRKSKYATHRRRAHRLFHSHFVGYSSLITPFPTLLLQTVLLTQTHCRVGICSSWQWMMSNTCQCQECSCIGWVVWGFKEVFPGEELRTDNTAAYKHAKDCQQEVGWGLFSVAPPCRIRLSWIYNQLFCPLASVKAVAREWKLEFAKHWDRDLGVRGNPRQVIALPRWFFFLFMSFLHHLWK